MRLHQGKTRVWNAAGEEASSLARLQPVGADPVWTGAWSLPADQRGLLVLGAPLGSEAFVRRELGRKRVVQASCSAVSLLSAICNPRGSSCCFVPRRVQTICFGCCRQARRKATQAFAREHDTAVRACLAALLFQSTRHPLPEPSQRLAHLPLRFGGLGLRSAVDAAPSAYRASWADCLLAIRARAPLAADRLVQALQSATETAAPLAAARHAAAYLREQGYDAPPWASLQQGQPPPRQSDRHFGDFLRGWQHGASLASDKRALELHLSHLDAASRALLLSQAGPHECF